jgi:type II secretory pathway pseudopilin PulG
MLAIIHNHRQRFAQRPGLTLIELLIVIAILMIVTVAAVPLLQPPNADRKLREAAREFVSTLDLAKARAIETGRPAGIWIDPQPAVNGVVESYKIFLCDVPPPYAGDTLSSSASFNTTGNQVTLNGASSVSQLCKYGDTIRFNSRGTYYSIAGGTAGQNISGSSFTITAPLGYSLPPANFSNVPFQIFRQPVKSSVGPTILPTNAPAAVIDLSQSGYGDAGTQFSNTQQPGLMLTFLPSGQMEQVYRPVGNSRFQPEKPIEKLYFLIRLRREAGTTAAKDDFVAQWVSINPYTGLVNINDVAAPLNDNSFGASNIATARSLVKTSESRGGN